MREHILHAYMMNIVTYLHLLHPNIDMGNIESFVRSYIENKCEMMKSNLRDAIHNHEDLTIPRTGDKRLWPTIRAAHYSDENDSSLQHSYGNMKIVETEDLLGYIARYRDKVITPFGSIYETADHISSFLKGMIDEKSAMRKKEKKLMLQARLNNNKIAATYHNNNQSTIKVNMNSLIGAMGLDYNFLSNVANFNSVTSTGRYFVTNAFAHGERFLHGNFFFLTEEELINHIVNCVRHGPDDQKVLTICADKNIKIPTSDEVYNFLIFNLNKYQYKPDHPRIRALLSSCTTGQLTFLYYMSNMKQLVFENEQFFRPWIDLFFSNSDVDISHLENVDPHDLNKLDGDLTIVISTVYNPEMPVNEKSNSISIYDTIDQYPDLAKKFVVIGNAMQKKLDDIKDLFDLFMNHQIAVSYVHEHKHMLRDVIVLSDTDSILFTTKDWVEWYQHSMKFTPTSFSMNALVVYWLSKSIKSMLAHMSKAIGAVGKDITKMNMKNEFMMPIEIMTSLKKHYASILAIQEGVFYKIPRLDIKGGNLRGSTYSQETLNYVEWWIQDIINEIYSTGCVEIRKRIADVLRFERVILDSLHQHQVTFLTADPIRMESEYKNADSTIYHNYLFWEAVFAEKYGHILIPAKCYIAPLLNIAQPKYINFLKQKYPEIANTLIKYLTTHKDKEITRIPLNPITNTIPEELYPVINYKSIIYDNIKPFYIILQSFGISMGNDTFKVLLSDQYGWVSSEEANICKKHM